MVSREQKREWLRKAREVQSERARFTRAMRPDHTRMFAQFSEEWFLACNEAFVREMMANPGERPSGFTSYNGAGSGR